MGVITKDFQQDVLDDMKSYSILTHTEKASLPERILVKMVPITSLHPNPDDEFVNPEIGPNNNIVGEYKNTLGQHEKNDKNPAIEPILVEKVSTGGFMILNGHHRWLAAKKMGLKRVPIRIVNPTHEEDILQKLETLNGDMCVAIDLDEVLICKDNPDAVNKLIFPLGKIYTWPIRKETGPLINTLRRMGCDVWIYSGNFNPPQFIRATLAAHGANKIDGVICGFQIDALSADVRKAVRKKYRSTVHIDGERMLWFNSDSKEFESYGLVLDDAWARKIAAKIQDIIKSDTKKTEE